MLFKAQYSMNNSEVDHLFREYTSLVINKLKSDELSSTFSGLPHFLIDRTQNIPAWQVALPVIACLAAGGSTTDGTVLSSAWVPLILASEILDDVEDKELTNDQYLISPEVASNLATGLIFFAFHSLTSIQNARKANQVTKIFSRCGFNAASGQHRDLMQEQLPVELCLTNYWENIILKSGSVFRAATEGGAIAAGAIETISEALGDYGTALGVILQLMDDCRDAFSQSQDEINWEVSLPLLLYLMAIEEENLLFPEVSSRAAWSEILQKTGVIHTISELLLQWRSRALESLVPLPQSREKLILERIPFMIFKRIPSIADEVIDEKNI